MTGRRPHLLAILAVTCAGCPGPQAVDASIVDAPPALDVPEMIDAPTDAGDDAPIDVSSAMDVPAMADAPVSGCGWDEDAATFVCGGSDPLPDTCVAGERCCIGVCDPFGTDQVCCDPATGTIEIYRYGGGACPLETTTDC